MAEGRQGSSTSDGAASRMNNKAIIDFLLESDSDLWSLSEESSDEDDENDISIDSETEEEIILEEHEDIIDNSDEETSEAPDARLYKKTLEKDLHILRRQDKTKEKNPQISMKESNCKKTHQLVGWKGDYSLEYQVFLLQFLYWWILMNL